MFFSSCVVIELVPCYFQTLRGNFRLVASLKQLKWHYFADLPNP